MSDDANGNGWLRPSALAKREGVARPTVWEWARKGLVEVKRVGPGAGVRMRIPDPPPARVSSDVVVVVDTVRSPSRIDVSHLRSEHEETRPGIRTTETPRVVVVRRDRP